MEDTEKLKYPGMRADISRCNELLHELCQIVWDRNYKAEQVVFSIPPVPRNFDMQFSAAFDELAAYRDIGTVEELTALAKAHNDGRVVVLPYKVGDTVYTIYDNGEDKPQLETRKVSEMSTARIWLDGDRYFFPYDYFSKTVFLTRAEAEAALKGGADHETN